MLLYHEEEREEEDKRRRMAFRYREENFRNHSSSLIAITLIGYVC